MIKTIPDNRGTFNILEGKNFDQIFISKSDKKFTFRGMHYQTDPYQIKTLKIIQGSAIDFIYNIDKSPRGKKYDIEEFKKNYISKSPTYQIIDCLKNFL